jgi:hypothetical protein
MRDFEQVGKEVLKGTDAKKLNEVANSADGKKIASMLDAKAVERAAKSGDTAALQEILSRVLNTDEGKRLAQSISGIIGKK